MLVTKMWSVESAVDVVFYVYASFIHFFVLCNCVAVNQQGFLFTQKLQHTCMHVKIHFDVCSA